MTFKVLDLFSGIGGFSLGLERTGGFKTVAFCEIEQFPRRVLAHHWPGVPIYDDVRELTADTLRRDGIAVDVITAGFPCQDVSVAGNRAGIEGKRTGLWSEVWRLSGELRPGFLILENVPGLLSAGAGRVLGELSQIGYDATWECIPASAVGAPHRRDRWWCIATDAIGNQLREQSGRGRWPCRSGEAVACNNGASQPVADANSHWKSQSGGNVEQVRGRALPGCEDVADTSGRRRGRPHSGQVEQPRRAETVCSSSAIADTNSDNGQRVSGEAEDNGLAGRTQWSFEPDVGRVAHGVPDRVAKLTGLGNAVVPQVVELIGRAILSAEAA